MPDGRTARASSRGGFRLAECFLDLQGLLVPALRRVQIATPLRNGPELVIGAGHPVRRSQDAAKPSDAIGSPKLCA